MEIKTWEEADRALERFTRVEAELAEHLAALDRALVKLRATYQRHTDLTTAEIAEIQAALKKFATAHKAEFKPSPAGDGRSYEHGGAVLGFRQSPGRVEIRQEAEALEWLRDFRQGEFLRVRHEPDREKLLEILRSAQDDRLVERLAAHGIRFQQNDKFFLEVKGD